MRRDPSGESGLRCRWRCLTLQITPKLSAYSFYASKLPTYSALGERLSISPEAARQKAIRYRWPRRPANDGKTQVRVDVEDVKASTIPRKPRESSDDRLTPELPPVEQASDARALLDALEAHITTLKGVVAKAEEAAARESARRC